jgi:hypothetical protein
MKTYLLFYLTTGFDRMLSSSGEKHEQIVAETYID